MKKRNLKILIVEDNKINQLILKQLLLNNDHLVFVAENGQKAIEEVGTNNFDIILMDLMMPVMNGFDATKEIRRTETKRIPIVAVTSNILNNEEIRCQELGMDGFIAKPISAYHLKNAFAQVGLLF